MAFRTIEDRKGPAREAWNQNPPEVRHEVVELGLERKDLSAREVACAHASEKRYFVPKSSVCRILKAHGLITSPAYMLMSASDNFKTPTHRVHELWQTDFTDFRVIGWGWYNMSKTRSTRSWR